MLELRASRTRPLLAALLALTLLFSGVPFGHNGIHVAHAATQATYYVAPNGSDSNPGTLSQPFKTLQRARDVVRTINASMTGDIYIYMLQGDYYVTSTIQFAEQDSGTNGFQVIYKNYDAPGSARFVGSQKITNWTQHSGNIYKANVGVGWKFNTLYENGKRAIKARHPNYKVENGLIMSQADYLSTDAGGSGSNVFVYKSGNLDPRGWSLNDAQVYIFSGTHDWFSDTVPIKSIDTSTRKITLKQNTRYTLKYEKRSRYFVQGVLQLLDTPGEFHLDTATGTLYYWAKDGAIATQVIAAPKVKTILSVKGSSESKRVHNITFSGLSFEATDFTDWYRHGWPNDNGSGENHQYSIYDRQIEMTQHRTGMIFMQNTDHVTVSECHLKNSGYSSIFMLFYNQNNTISSNWIEHSGYAGVFMEGKYPGEGNVLRNNTLTNNLIHDVGELTGHAAGYLAMQSYNNEFSYSEIYNSPRFGIYIAGYRELPNNTLYSTNNTVKYLKIHDAMQDTNDGGAVYSFGVSTSSTGPYQFNTYDQITVDRSWANSSIDQAGNFLPQAVYMDEGTWGQKISNVKVTNIQQSGRPYKSNAGGNTLTNVSWQSGFDESKMDYPNIGVKRTFPYNNIRIDSGSSSAYASDPGKPYFADYYFTGGNTNSTASPISGTTDQDLFRTYRYGNFSYKLPVANGTYKVYLKFVEPYFSAANSRVFTVKAEGSAVLTNIDLYSEAGGKNKAIEKTVTVTVLDGELSFDFVPSTNNAIISGIVAIKE